MDGFGFDDLDVTSDGAHGVTFTFRQGDRLRAFTLAIPWLVYRGVYAPDTDYAPGDVATLGGSAWICRAPTTTKPGDDADAWTLAVKRGRDGRDGAPPRRADAVLVTLATARDHLQLPIALAADPPDPQLADLTGKLAAAEAIILDYCKVPDPAPRGRTRSWRCCPPRS